MQQPHACRLSRFLILLFAAAAGCSSDDLTTPPGSSTLEITTTTSGTETDPDGYTVQVDGDNAQAIGTAATISRTDISAGDHTVQLGGLAANCSVTGENPRTVSVPAGQIMSVAFEVTCGPTSGGLQITTSTTGSSPDADGYSITVDGTAQGTISASGSVNLAGVTAGQHEIGLSGVAANCTVSGDNPQSVAVAAGASTAVSFGVSCAAAPVSVGTLQVTTVTGGASPDPNGYNIALDGGATQPIGVNATLPITGVAAGAHRVALSGLATNCSVQGDNPRQVTVAAGSTAKTAFSVDCGGSGGGGGGSVSHWVPLSTGTEFKLSGISGRSARDLFAVGFNTPGEDPVDASAVLHFDGSNWSELYRNPDLHLSGVWTSSQADVFAAGHSSAQGATLLHFNGTAWAETTVPQLLQGDETRMLLNAIWGSSPSDVFAVGTAVGSRVQSAILHYDGTGWSRMTVPSSDDLRITGVWGSSAQSVYAVGWSGDLSSTTRVVLHYDGRNWTVAYQAPGGSGVLRAVWTSGDGKVIAVGDGTALHYDGSAWSTKPLPNTTNLSAVWGASATDAYAVGTSGVIFHFDGSSWTEMPAGRVTNLLSVWGSSSSDVYAGGEGGVILHGTP